MNKTGKNINQFTFLRVKTDAYSGTLDRGSFQKKLYITLVLFVFVCMWLQGVATRYLLLLT